MTYQIQFINSKTNKIFHLSSTYADRTEACVCGQNYCRDRQQEDGTVLFFRVVDRTEKNPYPQVQPLFGECDNDCPTNCEEDSEEPVFTEFEEIVNLLFGN